MQRVSDGLEVPKLMLDVFTGKVTGTGADTGKVVCDLTYQPKSIDHIITPIARDTGEYLVLADVYALSGKELTLKICAYSYYKLTALEVATSACDGSGLWQSHGGHNFVNTLTYVHMTSLSACPLGTIRVHYTVA